jgi:hypothetical protein
MQKNTLKDAMMAAREGKTYPIQSMVRKDPGMAALISKMIHDTQPATYNQRGTRDISQPNVGAFNEISDRTTQSIMDAQTVMQLLPDMKLAAQILVSSILSPKDMMTMELTYGIAEGLMAPDVSAAMISEARKYFEQDYKIKPLLAKMLNDMLFEKGSYAVAVIPENSIDEAINGVGQITMESLSEFIDTTTGVVKPLSILGPVVRNKPTKERAIAGLAIESLNYDDASTELINPQVMFEGQFPTKISDTFLSVTDNHTLLKIPQINQKIRETRILKHLASPAMESLRPAQGFSDRTMVGLLYKNKQASYTPIAQLKTQDQLIRKTIGAPVVWHFPSESVIPVHVPGQVEKQIGFFILTDGDGHPITKADNPDHYQQLGQRLTANGNFSSAMLGRVKSQMQGFDQTNQGHLDFSARVYGSMVEQDLMARLRNGQYGNGVSIAKKEEIYRIMFARALAKQHTQLLFIPAELMTYFAFAYDNNGIGKSVMEDMKILNSLRSMLLFANVQASLKNSIGRTEVKLKLDESDPNPQKTIETSMDLITKSRNNIFPVGMSNPTDIADWLAKSGFEFTYEGHPGMPDVKVEFGEKASNYVKPDQELTEALRKQAIMATGLPPELVDAGFQSEFAIGLVTNNALLSKRVMKLQDDFTPQLTHHLRTYMMNHENCLNGLREILRNHFDKLGAEKTDKAIDDKLSAENQSGPKVIDGHEDNKLFAQKEAAINEYLMQFLMNFEVSLPKPNSVTLENQVAALETYSKALDATLDAYMSDKFFTDATGGAVAAQVGVMKEIVKAYFVRQWMTENGMMTELSTLTNLNSEGLPSTDVYQIQESHIKNLMKSMSHFMVGLQPVKKMADKVMGELGVDTSGGGSNDFGGGDTGGSSSDGQSGNGTDDFSLNGGTDPSDFGMNMDTPSDDTEPKPDGETPPPTDAPVEGEEPKKDDEKKDDQPVA